MKKIKRKIISILLIISISINMVSITNANEVNIGDTEIEEVVVGSEESVEIVADRENIYVETKSDNEELEEKIDKIDEINSEYKVESFDLKVNRRGEIKEVESYGSEAIEQIDSIDDTSDYYNDENIDTEPENNFIEETVAGQDINNYEVSVEKKINEIIASRDNDYREEMDVENITYNSFLEPRFNNIENPDNIENNVETTETKEDNEIENISTNSEMLKSNDDVIKKSFKVGNSDDITNGKVEIVSTYDRYEIYTGENLGTIKISDDNNLYYEDDTEIKVIRELIDENNDSPIVFKLTKNVEIFGFNKSNDNYVLLPDGFVEDLVAKESGSGIINPQGINILNHIKVDLIFNTTDLGKYELYEYGIMYYLNCYEGILGEYYYYDPNTTDIERAAAFYINNIIMDRTYDIVSEYYYKSPSGERLSFKPSWILNSDNLVSGEKDTYVKQWVNFPYFLIKTGEKYWELRESIDNSTYLSEYSEGYYEQYGIDNQNVDIKERLTVLDERYKTEDGLIRENIETESFHPYVKSSEIKISGNFREDTITDENKLRAGGVLPYETYAVINLEVLDNRAKSVQVYLNGEKLISNNNYGIYSLIDGKCQIRIDGSKLVSDENSRNVICFILINELGNYLVDAQNRVINSYISLIRNQQIKTEKLNINFDTMGGSQITSVIVEEGNKLSLPKNPTKRSKNFLGWYNDITYQSKFDINEYITKSKTLYALWGDIVYSRGGSGGSSGGGVVALDLSQVNLDSESTNNNLSVKGNWYQNEGKWQFKDKEGNEYKDKWAYIDISNNPLEENADWYRFDESGNIITGFYLDNNKIYYFDDGETNKNNEGKMLKGWHWLKSFDYGYCCYYFDTREEKLGELVTNGITNDGYTVDQFGRWSEGGEVHRRSYR